MLGDPAIEESPDASGSKKSRRTFLGFAAAGVVTAGGATLALQNGGVATPKTTPDVEGVDLPTPTTTTTPLRAAADLAGRTLVVIELGGGNDGLATLVPRNAGVLYDRRPAVHIPDEELLDFSDDFGWNPALQRLSGHGVAALLGVGATEKPDGSHFEMERRWWTGQSSGIDLPATGFLGRLCDELDDDQPVTGLSIGSGATPALLSNKAVTMGLSDPDSGWFLDTDDPWFNNLLTGFRNLARESSGDSPPVAAARLGLSDTLSFADTLRRIDLDQVGDEYPNSDLGWQLGLTAEFIDQDAGIRVIHLAYGGFDTHSNQRGEHDNLLEELSDATGAFLEDLGARDRGDSTLVCTTSEFGRRVPDNDGGTDHGAASLAILAGPVVAGVHGEMPSLTNLDDDNLAATVDFEQYYATLAENWFGVPASAVLDGTPSTIDGLITF